MTFLIYIILGAFAGTLSGLFGIGGGIVIMPTLLFCFELTGIPKDISVLMAIGTSLSIIVVTVSTSSYAHIKKGGILWPVFLKLLIPVMIGSACGGYLSSVLDASLLELFFAIYVTLVCIKLFVDKNIAAIEKQTHLSLYGVVGFIIGLKSAILGIGGGTISIPFLNWRGFQMNKAVGISACLGVPISIIGASSYIINGQGVDLPANSFGYVYLPAFFGVILTSPIFAKLGAKLSHKLDHQLMKKLFLLFLVIVAIKTYYSILS